MEPLVKPSPALQAILLADHVYRDAGTAKAVIAGTFNTLAARTFPSSLGRESWAYLCLCDVRGTVEVSLRYVQLATGKVIMQLDETVVGGPDPLVPVEIVAVVPPLPMPAPGTFALEAHCNERLLGSVRLLVKRVED